MFDVKLVRNVDVIIVDTILGGRVGVVSSVKNRFKNIANLTYFVDLFYEEKRAYDGSLYHTHSEKYEVKRCYFIPYNVFTIRLGFTWDFVRLEVHE